MFSWSRDHPDLRSFPTRRSSDLVPLAVRLHAANGDDLYARGTTSPYWSSSSASTSMNSTHRPRWSPSDRKSTRLNSSHGYISYAVFCLKKKNPSTKKTNAPIQQL